MNTKPECWDHKPCFNTHLKTGTGYAWAGQRTRIVSPVFSLCTLYSSFWFTLGATEPTGSKFHDKLLY